MQLDLLYNIEINRTLALWAGHSTNTLQGINTGMNKIRAASQALGIVSPTATYTLAPTPVIRYQWFIIYSAMTPTRAGKPIKFSGLGNMFDAVAFSEKWAVQFDDKVWRIGRNATLHAYTCHSSATVLMQSFRRGLEVLMGGATTQVLCIDFEVVLDLQRLAEEQWQRLRARGGASVVAEL